MPDRLAVAPTGVHATSAASLTIGGLARLKGGRRRACANHVQSKMRCAWSSDSQLPLSGHRDSGRDAAALMAAGGGFRPAG
jgi:hypothetical protein